MPTEQEVDAAARAVFVAWRDHMLTQGAKANDMASTFDDLDSKEKKFAFANARAALVAAEQVRASS